MEEQTIVGVKFEDGGKIYYFNPLKNTYNKNDTVIVETSNGLAVGTISIANTTIDAKTLVEPLKNVVRLATEKDFNHIKRLKEKQRTAKIEARKQAENLKLEMQIIDAEYSFDETKVVITFTAEGRVDFRDLVKYLANILHARVELRQVGIRDEAKILGGIGPCGKEVCCKQFLSDFNKVSIKMAKNQGISLNPTNINGLCGRLLCCLAYENDHYVELINQMPKLNSMVSTPNGNGVVVYNNLLKKIVSVKIKKGEDDFSVEDFALDDIKIVEGNNDKQ